MLLHFSFSFCIFLINAVHFSPSPAHKRVEDPPPSPLTPLPQIPGVEVMLFSIKDATSIRDAQLDILHSVTRWLDEEDLTYSTLRRLEYNTPPPSTSEVQAIMEKYQRPLTADERDAATLRALGRTPNNETREQLKKLQARFDVEAALLKEDLARVQREERLKRGEYTAHQPQGRGARIVTSADDIKGVEDVFTETPKVC